MRTILIRDAQLVTRKSRSGILIYKNSYKKEVNLRDIEALIILGSKTKIDTGVITLLSRYNIPVSIVSKIGVSIMTTPVITLYNEIRKSQYTLNDQEKIDLMTEILISKFKGLSNILKYHEKDPPEPENIQAKNGEELLRWEAQTSRTYWKLLIELIPEKLLRELKQKYDFQGRRPRAKDPFNQAISLLYAILYSIATRALLASGLDPTYGLHHKTRYSTPLVFDYTEMYKPIAIHAVIKYLRKTNKLPELDEEGYISKESMNTLMKEFYSILRAKIRETKIIPYKAIYVNALKLAKRIRTKDNTIRYTYTYNPKKLLYSQE